jgi:spore germination cell wall hydrolase CwlJ-like protein
VLGKFREFFSHFAARSLANPTWSSYPEVAKIGDHTFYKVDRLKR